MIKQANPATARGVPGRRVAAIAAALLVVSLALPSVDTRFEDQVGGFDVRGYQCFVGVFLAPFVAPGSTPVWILIGIANVQLLLLPLALAWTDWRRWAKPVLLAGAGCAIYVCFFGQHSGVSRIHVGAWVWLASLILGAVACWRARSPSPPA